MHSLLEIVLHQKNLNSVDDARTSKLFQAVSRAFDVS